jgi:hypothetical protein
MSRLIGSVLSIALIGAVIGEALPEADADPACNNCGQRPPYIKGARVRPLSLIIFAQDYYIKLFFLDILFSWTLSVLVILKEKVGLMCHCVSLIDGKMFSISFAYLFISKKPFRLRPNS